MDRTRKATREGNEITLQHVSPQEALRIQEIDEENLARLLASLEQLQQTPAGIAELDLRTKAFGECRRIEGETAGQFAHKLRVWLERYIPQSKAPLHPPRQVD